MQEEADFGTPHVRALLEQRLRFAKSVSRPEDVYALGLDGRPDPAITFFSLRFDGELLGVGAIKLLGPDHAELKSMHTAVAARRRGSAAMVNHLLAWLPSGGFVGSAWRPGRGRRSRPRAPFTPPLASCGPFGDYPESPNSSFMTRLLS